MGDEVLLRRKLPAWAGCRANRSRPGDASVVGGNRAGAQFALPGSVVPAKVLAVWRDLTAPPARLGRPDPKRFAAGSRAALLTLVLLHVVRSGNRCQALPSPCEKSELCEHRQRGPAV